MEFKTLKITKETHKVLKTYCVTNELNMNEVADSFILNELKSGKYKISASKSKKADKK